MDTTRTGQGMIALGFIALLAVLATFFGNFERRQYNPNQQPLSTATGGDIEVTLQRNRQGHYVVTGSINDREVDFLLDTGATFVAVPGGLADRLALKRGQRGTAMTAAGSVTVFSTLIEVIRIGDIHFYNVPASINPSMHDDEVLLGMSALSQLEFSQSDGMLTLRQRGSGPRD